MISKRACLTLAHRLRLIFVVFFMKTDERYAEEDGRPIRFLSLSMKHVGAKDQASGWNHWQAACSRKTISYVSARIRHSCSRKNERHSRELIAVVRRFSLNLSTCACISTIYVSTRQNARWWRETPFHSFFFLLLLKQWHSQGEWKKEMLWSISIVLFE